MRSLVRSHSDDRRIRRLSLALGVSLALAAGSALSEAPKAAATDSKGIMTFPNVRVVNAPQAAEPAKQSSTQQGLKGYLGNNGEFREQSAEERIEEATAAKAKVQAKSLNRSTARSASLAPPNPNPPPKADRRV
jgi:hypothetical protein